MSLTIQTSLKTPMPNLRIKVKRPRLKVPNPQQREREPQKPNLVRRIHQTQVEVTAVAARPQVPLSHQQHLVLQGQALQLLPHLPLTQAPKPVLPL